MKPKAEHKRITDEAWCKSIIARLGKYKENLGTMEYLLTEMEKSTFPKAKLVATYGDNVREGTGLGTISPDEIEYQELLWEQRQLDGALNSLEKMQRDIIKLKYIEKMAVWHIIDIYIPKYYVDKYKRPLSISKATFYNELEKAFKQMGKILGYFSKN